MLLAMIVAFAGWKATAVSAAAPGFHAQFISAGNFTDFGGGDGGGGGGFGGLGGFGGGFFLGSGVGGLTGGGIVSTIVIVAFVILIFILRTRFGGMRRRGGGGGNFKPLDIPPLDPVSQDDIIASITEHDPDFSQERFISWAKLVFIELQSAWTARDWKRVRPFESQDLFSLHRTQLDEFISNGTINVMENVCVNEAYLYDYKQEGEYEYLTVFMQTRYNDYIINEKTRKVVKGDPKTTYNQGYHLRFMRSLGVQTTENSNASTTKCPNCGAPVDVNAAGQCSYCGSVVTSGHHDWVLCNLEATH
jgi:hypothetical protein